MHKSIKLLLRTSLVFAVVVTVIYNYLKFGCYKSIDGCLLEKVLFHNFYYKADETQPIQSSKPFDKVYVINLERSKDRLDHISKNFKAANVQFERIEAVDGYKAKLTNFFSNENFSGADIKSDFLHKSLINMYGYYIVDCDLEDQEKFIANNFAMQRPYIQSAGEIGCSCSHYKIWREIVSKGYFGALIFEDDAVLPESFLSDFSKLTKNLDPQFDILYFFNNEKTNSLPLAINLPIRIKGQALSHGYYLSNKGAKKLLEYAQGPGLFKSKNGVDAFMIFLVDKGGLDVYAPSTNDLISTDTVLAGKSTLKEMGRKF